MTHAEEIDRDLDDIKTLSSVACWMQDCPGPKEWTWIEDAGCYAATCECGETVRVSPAPKEENNDN